MKPLHPVISRCRICQNSELVTILDLGVQALTGIFPKTKEQPVGKGPLELVKCHGGDQACGLVQLRHNYDPSQLFGDTYGYRSGLNESMVLHLSHTVQRLLQRKTINKGDVVLDIASNDGTTLSFFPSDATLIGMDPSAARWAGMYKPHIVLVSDFFSPERFLQASAGQRAKLITTIAMFYDLEDPLAFMRQVSSILADDGLWFLEQSYLPLMLKSNSYDTVCHEHLEYYAMSQFAWMAPRVGLEIVDVELNEANGGSFAVTLAKQGAGYGRSARVDELIAEESQLGLGDLQVYRKFAKDAEQHRDDLRTELARCSSRGRLVLGLGASTKGNVILQYCGLGELDLPAIGEVNEDKFGSFTPGSLIPIVREADVLAENPYALLVLPWHFRANLTRRLAPFTRKGGKLLFPLPNLEFVSGL